MRTTEIFTIFALATGLGGAAMAGDVIRHPLPSDFPIALAVEIPASKTMVRLSGTVPSPVEGSDPAAPEFGDTETQTVSVFNAINANLENLGLTMSDVTSLTVFLVAPEGADGMDFSGFMDGYVQFFGTDDQPNLPARSVVEVAGLVNPGWFVEIEAIAVRD